MLACLLRIKKLITQFVCNHLVARGPIDVMYVCLMQLLSVSDLSDKTKALDDSVSW